MSHNQAVAAWNNQFFSSLTCKIRKLVRHPVLLFYNIPIYTNVTTTLVVVLLDQH